MIQHPSGAEFCSRQGSERTERRVCKFNCETSRTIANYGEYRKTLFVVRTMKRKRRKRRQAERVNINEQGKKALFLFLTRYNE